MPKDVVSNIDPTFLSEVWKKIFKVHGVTLKHQLPITLKQMGQLR